ncbi:RIC1-domain-containing protein [Neolentinus lepideus HHB14362 ss-1]|uniref:RIC1-domain-containing protein n=1 Tax=Neolentinus lepideus HHB14362 ss-1 TaxID=1314782 RepID=A0A165QAE2_9AGAM|nr:RIC1-domain-containing protein [Neolentinus lepideus HHB14362 ss-1]
MYFPTSAARQLCTKPALPDLPPELALSLCPSPHKSWFCSLTRSGLSIWRVRPSVLLAYLARTETSLDEHGDNAHVHWSPEGKRIVIQTTKSYLLLLTVEYDPDVEAYKSPPLASSAQRHFFPGPGEGLSLQGLALHLEGVVRIDGHLLWASPRRNFIIFSTASPRAIQCIPWPGVDESGPKTYPPHKDAKFEPYAWYIEDHEFPWLVDRDVAVTKVYHPRGLGAEIWITSDGRAYFVGLRDVAEPNASNPELSRDNERPRASLDANGKKSASLDNPGRWHGTCIHNFEIPHWVQKQRQVDPDDIGMHQYMYDEPRRAVSTAVNSYFSLVAIGTHGGEVHLTNFPSQDGVIPRSQTLHLPSSVVGKKPGSVLTMEWSSDGYVLAVGWEHGWAVWSVGGRCLAWGFGIEDHIDAEKFQDLFMNGIRSLFWSPGNFELIVLAACESTHAGREMFIIPFAKSAATGQHAPDNTRYAFLQMDDRVLIYRGADQPDMSVINPESDVWQHIQTPQSYLANNWPIRYSAISSDGRLVAVAGRRGLVHYSSSSGRWKLFADEMQEQAFAVKGGLLWFHHVLIVAVEVSKSHQIRLYSRDLELSSKTVLHREIMSSPVVILSLVDNSLLVYTMDNTLIHYLIVPTTDTIRLHLCGSITFDGIIAAPSAVRMLSWMIPNAQKQLGDPVDDLSVATVLMMVGGKLVLLRPGKLASQEVRYDMQILADRVEFCWIHLRGIGALENSLWGYDGQSLRIWLNALAIEPTKPNPEDDVEDDASLTPKESLSIQLDFYPLSVLMDKGIIIGVEHEAVARTNLPFVIFRHATSSHLFLHHVLLAHLEAGQVQRAALFASHYQSLVYFAHALEILLHTIVESESGSKDAEANGDGVPSDDVLHAAVEFLDHFDESLDVVVRCARKTEMTRWRRLFDVVGNPKSLFETCLTTGRLKTAASYLLVLHNLEQLDESNEDAHRLLKVAMQEEDWQLCRELLRFLRSIDESGLALRDALIKANVVSDFEAVVNGQ